MEAHDRIVHSVSQEQDDVLATIQLVQGEPALEDRLFERLVDLLVEGMFLDLRQLYLEGGLSPDAYTAELSDLASRCRGMGLLPLSSRTV